MEMRPPRSAKAPYRMCALQTLIGSSRQLTASLQPPLGVRNGALEDGALAGHVDLSHHGAVALQVSLREHVLAAISQLDTGVFRRRSCSQYRPVR